MTKKPTLAVLARTYGVSVSTLSRLRAKGIDIYDRAAVFAEFYAQRSAPSVASASAEGLPC